MCRPALEHSPRENAVRRPAVITALSLLGLPLCVAGCRPTPAPPVPRPSVVLKIPTAEVQSKVVPPGHQVTVGVQYYVAAPPERAALRATVSGQLFFHQQPLAPLPRVNIVLQTSDPLHSFSYPI